MAASTITRTSWTDDDGTGTTGTIINNAQLQAIYDAIDQLFSGSGSYATVEFGGNVQVDGYLVLKGSASDPAVSAASTSRLTYNSTKNRIRASVNGAGYKNVGLRTFEDPSYCGGTAHGAGRN